MAILQALLIALPVFAADIRHGPQVKTSTGIVSIAGSVTVTPGTGTVNVACVSGCAAGASGQGTPVYSTAPITVAFSSGSFSNPFYTLSTNTVVSTGSITAFQGGTWTLGTGTAEIGNVKNTGTFAVQAAQSGDYIVNKSTLAVVNAAGGNLSVTFPSAQAVTGPLTDAQLRATAVPVSGSVSVNGSTMAVVNANGANLNVNVNAALPAGANAIGKLAANSGVDIGDVDVTSLPSIPAGSNNIGTVNGTTVAVTNVNGASLNVNCASGCSGAPSGQGTAVYSTAPVTVQFSSGSFSNPLYVISTNTFQSASYVMFATSTLVANATNFCLINKSTTKTVKVRRVDLVNYTTATVTGLITKFDMLTVTAGTKGGTLQISTTTMSPSDEGLLDPLVEGSTGTVGVTFQNSSGSQSNTPMASSWVQTDETPTFDPAVVTLFDYRNMGEKPLTFNANSTRGFCVLTKSFGAVAGRIGVRTFFTQE